MAESFTESKTLLKFDKSSYSGADLRVVAHLYHTVQGIPLGGPYNELLKEKQDIEEQLQNIEITNFAEIDNATALRLAEIRIDHEHILSSINEQLAKLDTQLQFSSDTVELGTLQTISLQSFREVNAVRALGHSYAKSYVAGQRTLAGSMIFTLFNEHPLIKLIRAMSGEQGFSNYGEISSLIPDQLPPIDLTLIFSNEYGAQSEQRLYGVQFMSDSSTYSIEDILSEQVLQFVARDIDILSSTNIPKNVRTPGTEVDRPTTGSSLLYNNDAYSKYKDKIGIRTGRFR